MLSLQPSGGVGGEFTWWERGLHAQTGVVPLADDVPAGIILKMTGEPVEDSSRIKHDPVFHFCMIILLALGRIDRNSVHQNQKANKYR